MTRHDSIRTTTSSARYSFLGFTIIPLSTSLKNIFFKKLHFEIHKFDICIVQQLPVTWMACSKVSAINTFTSFWITGMSMTMALTFFAIGKIPRSWLTTITCSTINSSFTNTLSRSYVTIIVQSTIPVTIAFWNIKFLVNQINNRINKIKRSLKKVESLIIVNANTSIWCFTLFNLNLLPSIPIKR